MLRFDGIYQSKLEGYSSYIRFFKDGTVITANSTDPPQLMKYWFVKDPVRQGAGKGNFVLNGNLVKFMTTSISGIVEYEGRIHRNKMVIEAYSRIKQRRFIREYEFVQLRLT